jgi:hypothetical protein
MDQMELLVVVALMEQVVQQEQADSLEQVQWFNWHIRYFRN